jgi:hypothetical protein
MAGKKCFLTGEEVGKMLIYTISLCAIVVIIYLIQFQLYSAWIKNEKLP